jgi:hypothetical protein
VAVASSPCDDYFFLAAFFAGFFAAAFFAAMRTPPPFDVKMLVVRMWYSRVCATSKILFSRFLRQDYVPETCTCSP